MASKKKAGVQTVSASRKAKYQRYRMRMTGEFAQLKRVRKHLETNPHDLNAHRVIHTLNEKGVR